MLYDKGIPKVCAHCLFAQEFTGGHNLCRRLGPVSPDYSCRHFKYDPLRRRPPKPPRLLLPLRKDAFDL